MNRRPTGPTPADRRPIGLSPGTPSEGFGQDTAKYLTPNPVVRRLLARLLVRVQAELGQSPGILVDVGAGEGLALQRIGAPDRCRVVALDRRLDKLAAARSRVPAVPLVCADAGMLPFPDASVDTVMGLEVLEHLVRPEAAVAEMARVSRDRVLVTVPWEPFFRVGNLVRGKNIGRFGDDVEHVQHFNRARLRLVLTAHLGQVTVSGRFPWLIGDGHLASAGGARRTPRAP